MKAVRAMESGGMQGLCWYRLTNDAGPGAGSELGMLTDQIANRSRPIYILSDQILIAM